MDAQIYIGPAGWSYPDWEGIVYPREVTRQRRQLQWISRWFNLVEINNSFYRIPTPRQVEKWAAAVASVPAFRFSVKLYQGFTHEAVLDQAQVAAFREALSAFAATGLLGAVLVQFPWSLRCDREGKIRLNRVLEAFGDFPLAVEVRHAGWDTPAYLDYLRQHGWTFCNIDQPVIGQSLGLTAHVTATRAYLRLHGRNRQAWFSGEGRDARYDYLYGEAEIEAFVRIIQAMVKQVQEIYIVTNNHYRGKAVFNALQLGRRLVPGFAAAAPLEIQIPDEKNN
jgi:uncharacterized protein YecE (DUF72 family)